MLKNGVPEAEFLKILDKITKKLSYTFKFGYHSAEDIKQQAAIFALEGLEKYDNKRPLENFLWTHIRNRLFNFKRDKYQRPDKPCLSCPFHRPNEQSPCAKYFHQSECKEYFNWYKRNDSKKNIMKPMIVDNLNELFKSGSVTERLQHNEVFTLIDEFLPVQYRENYLKMLHGDKVPKAEQRIVIEQITNILKEHHDIQDS
jgi:hypothetical protein